MSSIKTRDAISNLKRVLSDADTARKEIVDELCRRLAESRSENKLLRAKVKALESKVEALV